MTGNVAAVDARAAIDRSALAEHGCLYVPGVVPSALAERLLALLPETATGARLSLRAASVELAMPVLAPIVAAWAPAARPVRCVLFDKTPDANWAVPWHQDRTIALAARHEVPGYGPWSVKQGVDHVEPPFSVMAAMLTLRLHLDDCPADNAPLLVVPGSHRQRHAAADTAGIARCGNIITCLAAAGDVWAYRTPIIHASQRAKHPLRRRVLQIDYCSASLPPKLTWAA